MAYKPQYRIRHEVAFVEPSLPSATTTTTNTQKGNWGARKDHDSPENPKQDPRGQHGSPHEHKGFTVAHRAKQVSEAIVIAPYYR